MHYYTKNIADFNNATRHLTRQQRSIYSDLIELQYDIETPLPDDISWICKRIIALSDSERTDVEQMLNEYFDLVEQGWSNARCEQEIATFADKRGKAIAAGKASGKARRRNKKPTKTKTTNTIEQTLNGRSTDVEPTNNHKPITNSQETPTINQEPESTIQSKDQDAGASLSVFEHWQSVMGKKASRFTPTRKTKINARLKSFTEDQIKSAIDGCSKSEFHMGKNDNKAEYNSIELICRNDEKVEFFMELNNSRTATNNQLKDWIND